MKSLRSEMRNLFNSEKIKIYKNFHKTEKGDYAHGEEFLGLTVPQLRKIASGRVDLEFKDILELLNSRVHEEKYVAALILSEKYKFSDEKSKKEIFDFSVSNAEKFSGWDLVDTIAPSVFGIYLLNRDKSKLYVFAKSDNLWEKRIAIVSTYPLIKNNKFDDTLKISEILLKDKHDLIHKACGWMLREVGKKDIKKLKEFLKKHYKNMPRTMLRYAIERFSDKERKLYLRGEI